MSTSNGASEGERAELEAVLTSGIFSRSSRQADLVSYVCDEYFAGRAGQMKEYNLATEVLKRPSTFDPSHDAIVRVEFFRIRKKLKDYYEGEGAGHALQLVVQPGQYVPRFVEREKRPYQDPEPEAEVGQEQHVSEVVPDAAVPGPPAGRDERFQRMPWVAGLALVALLALAAILLLKRPKAAVQQTNGGSAEAPSAGVPGRVGEPNGDVRILAGYLKGTYVDRAGDTWEGDRYFEGGEALAQPRQFIARTPDPTIFQTLRSGEFSYDIPLQPGNYELSLYFAESHYGPDTLSGGGETSRLFDVFMNGQPLLHLFDIIKDAGGNNRADVRVFKNVSPAADGKLHLQFRPLIDSPILNAIEIVPAPPGRINPMRIVAQQNSYTDHNGYFWKPDRFASGGQLAVHMHRNPVSGTPDPDLYDGERFGNFDYAIPVPPGKYGVTLRFAETYWGTDNQRPGVALPDYQGSPQGGAGSRVFDVYFNGRTLLKDFDIFEEAGGAGRALDKTFHGLEPNAEGKLVLSFVPDRDYACVNAIEVVDESR
ncbi:MAG TPA: malectin domain-containing carbohydrate-binding protein [Terriglobia bacterium]|nr:malectin domain-containing carbohydrate-binding protein [Terriglobia bacterium]